MSAQYLYPALPRRLEHPYAQLGLFVSDDLFRVLGSLSSKSFLSRLSGLSATQGVTNPLTNAPPAQPDNEPVNRH